MIAMTEIPKATRKQLADALGEALGPRCCPNCGERDRTRVTKTLPIRREIRRYLYCQVCAHTWRTDEKLS